jgi:hypothetical protein
MLAIGAQLGAEGFVEIKHSSAVAHVHGRGGWCGEDMGGQVFFDVGWLSASCLVVRFGKGRTNDASRGCCSHPSRGTRRSALCLTYVYLDEGLGLW